MHSASKQYRIGESHWIHLSHTKVVDGFTISPPNKVSGRMKAGAIVCAVVRFGANELIIKPIEEPH
jgi:uncharacterized OB-fold protein